MVDVIFEAFGHSQMEDIGSECFLIQIYFNSFFFAV